LSFVFIGIF